MVTALQPLDGSGIAQAGYDAGSRTFAVQYRAGSTIYHYKGVEPDIYNDFLKADSKGKFIGANVRGVYEFEKIEPEQDDA